MLDHAQDFSNLSGDFAILSQQISQNHNEKKKNMKTAHVYEIRHRKDDCGVNLISDVLPVRCAVLSGGPDAINNAIDYAKLYSRSHDAVIRVYYEAGDVIETHEQTGDFREF